MCTLSFFALRGAWLFFKPLPLRWIGGDGKKMLRESRWNHCCLILLVIFFHFRVTRTGIASGKVQHAILRASFRPNTTYKLYHNAFFKYYGRERNSSITSTILYPACSDCHATPQQQIMISLRSGLPFISKKMCK